MVGKLQKSLHDLKQAPRQCYAKAHQYRVDDLGFECSYNDPCLYVRNTMANTLLMELYVVDLLISGSNKTEIDSIKKELRSRLLRSELHLLQKV